MYVCGACGFSRTRLRSVQDHCRTRRAAATHPLGAATEITRRALPAPPRYLSRQEDRCALASQLARAAAELAARSADVARRCAELDALASRVLDWAPAHPFLSEPLPAERSLPARLAEVFGGRSGVVAHVTWTHVHSAGNVRSCKRPGHLAVYSRHGWHVAPARELAARACDAFPRRLEAMWDALGGAAAASLRGALSHFTRECGALLELDPAVFGAAAAAPDAAERERLVEDVAASLEHCCPLAGRGLSFAPS